MKKSFCFIATSILFFAVALTVSAESRCTILTKSLSYGSTNSNSGSQVSLLQSFLYSSGYLSATPTGHYGDLTVVAVKKFQKNQNLSTVGVVGPATRTAIQKISCSTPTSIIPTLDLCPNGNTIASSCASAPVSAVVPSVIPENNPIYSPSSNALLTIGQNYLIQWNGRGNQSGISFLLKDANGAGAGYLATNSSSDSNRYAWTVGNVYVSGQAQVVPPGNYQVNIIDNATYGAAFNIKSGIFTIREVPLYINNILPKQISAKSNTTVVLYGRGFSSLTRVTLTGGDYNPVIIPQSVSSDGSFVWFYVPQSFASGQYQVSVYNDYTSLNDVSTSTPSNTVSLQVNQATQ